MGQENQRYPGKVKKIHKKGKGNLLNQYWFYLTYIGKWKSCLPYSLPCNLESFQRWFFKFLTNWLKFDVARFCEWWGGGKLLKMIFRFFWLTLFFNRDEGLGLRREKLLFFRFTIQHFSSSETSKVIIIIIVVVIVVVIIITRSACEIRKLCWCIFSGKKSSFWFSLNRAAFPMQILRFEFLR